ncbi:hypothetical protein E3N88_30899 [Mikania micrantha]|uniref:Uncharacterized protein n=1 Tax=Mikania micrantha TaxID=192012 RepID=A0A5N6MMW9_9ASTR|nr:hypothetical protein E3N88_30899 [Mikania micrantha]
MDSKVIENIMKMFHFNGSGSLLYWQRIQVGNKWCLTLEGQPFLPTADRKQLKQYRNSCLKYSNYWVGQNTKVDQEWLAGLAAQEGIAYQRTSRDRDQFWGQLVVPVYIDKGKKLAGVIELAMYRPAEDFAADYLQLSNLLEGENLATKALIAKVTYEKDTIKFPLLSIGIEYLWENVTMRFFKRSVNQQAFLIKYVNRSGNWTMISSDDDLHACIADLNSGQLGFIQFWEAASISNDTVHMVVGQLYRLNGNDAGLTNYRTYCLNYDALIIGPDTQVDQMVLAGLAAQTGFAYQGTSNDRDQIMGQLVMPVYTNMRGHQTFLGVIEFVTPSPKATYNENLTTPEDIQE